jgi:hypothetical protein
MYTEHFTVGTFNFQNLMGFKLRLLDICNKKILLLEKCLKIYPFIVCSAFKICKKC